MAFRFHHGHFGLYDEPYNGLAFSDDGFLVYGNNYGDSRGASADPAERDQAEQPGRLDLAGHGVPLRREASAGVSLARPAPARDQGCASSSTTTCGRSATTRGRGPLDMEVMAAVGSNDGVRLQQHHRLRSEQVTIGAENLSGAKGTSLVNNGNASSVILGRDDRVHLRLYGPAPVPDGAQFTYQVTIDAGTAIGTELVNAAEHVTPTDRARSPRLPVTR